MSIKECGFAEVLVRLNHEMTKQESNEFIGQLINQVFSISDEWLEFHKKHQSKEYTFTTLIDSKTNNVLDKYEKGSTAYFRVYSQNHKLLSLIERKILKSSAFGVRDVELNTKEVYKNYIRLQIKNPILIYDKHNENVIFLRPDATEDEKDAYVKKVNELVVTQYNFMKDEQVPVDFEVFRRISDVKSRYLMYKDTKLTGTTGVLTCNQSDLAQELVHYAFCTGIGQKSALLGSGSSIPFFVANDKGEITID